MTRPAERPDALVLADPADVPPAWRAELDTVVSPCWQPGGLAGLPAGDPRLAGCQVLVTTPQPLDAAALARLPALRLLVATTTAVDYIDLAHCAERGIAVRSAGHYAGTSVAEHAFALLLASVRRLGDAEAAARGQAPPPDASTAFELAGRTAGVVGPGDIGGRIARIAAGVGMRVLVTGRPGAGKVRPAGGIPAGAVPVALDELLGAADAFFVAVPLTPDTRGLLDRRRLALLKPTAHLVSVAPDEVVDAAALVAALAAGRLGGAALDLVGDPGPYRDAPRLVLTRRWGIRTPQARERRARAWVTAVREGLATDPGPLPAPASPTDAPS